MFVELRECVENRQARSRGTFAVVVVGLGIAEVRHYAITEVLRDMTVEALNCLCRRTMVLPDDPPPFFRIKLRCDARRVHQIAKQHRQMAALALWHFMWLAV